MKNFKVFSPLDKSNYKLVRKDINNFEIVVYPNMPLRSRPLFHSENLEINLIVEHFISVLEQNISKQNLAILYKNLESCSIKKQNILSNFIFMFNLRGQDLGLYYPNKNKIVVVPPQTGFLEVSKEEYVCSLYHELLHLSSSLGKIKNGLVISGFEHQINGTKIIGRALDEGYTELLATRYFYRTNDLVSYDYETKIALLVEKIIGTSKMTGMYFNANLGGLCLCLRDYSSLDKVKSFILNLDDISRITKYQKRDIDKVISYHNAIAMFLIDAYKNKLNEDLNSKKITVKGYEKRLNNFMVILHKAFNMLNIGDYSKEKKLIKE